MGHIKLYEEFNPDGFNTGGYNRGNGFSGNLDQAIALILGLKSLEERVATYKGMLNNNPEWKLDYDALANPERDEETLKMIELANAVTELLKK